jgi:hypothetical protein
MHLMLVLGKYLTRRNYIVLGGSLLAGVLAVAGATQLRRSDPVTLPEETPIHVTLNQALTSNQNRPGDRFEATVSQPAIIAGKTAVPEGAVVEGLVVDSRASGRLSGRARLYLTLEDMQVNGKSYPIHTITSDRVGRSHKKRNWLLIGGGAGGGALIGAIAGGGKGALIGGPIGAGAGTAAALITGKKDIRLPAETRLTFRLADPVTVETRS